MSTLTMGDKKYKVPQITEGIRIQWHHGYWDGMLSGVVEYNGEHCWFDLKKEYDSKKLRNSVYRTFWLYKIPPEQWEVIKYWHDEFELHVGTHTSYVQKEDGTSSRDENVGKVHTASREYIQEMYFDRRKDYVAANGDETSKVSCEAQVIGWATLDVILGKKGQNWKEAAKAARAKKKAKNVTQEKAAKG